MYIPLLIAYRIPPTAVGGSFKSNLHTASLELLLNTPDGSRGIVQVQPIHLSLRDFWCTVRHYVPHSTLKPQLGFSTPLLSLLPYAESYPTFHRRRSFDNVAPHNG